MTIYKYVRVIIEKKLKELEKELGVNVSYICSFENGDMIPKEKATIKYINYIVKNKKRFIKSIKKDDYKLIAKEILLLYFQQISNKRINKFIDNYKKQKAFSKKELKKIAKEVNSI